VYDVLAAANELFWPHWLKASSFRASMSLASAPEKKSFSSLYLPRFRPGIEPEIENVAGKYN